MALKTFKTRIKNKIDNKSSLTDFVPLAGEFVIGKTNDVNNCDTPFVMKVGDGSTKWSSLPSIGPIITEGQAASFDGSSIKMTLSEYCQTYATYKFDETGSATNISIKIEKNSETYPSFNSTHYLLVDNSVNPYEKTLDGVSVAGVDGNNIVYQKAIIPAFDIVEFKITIYVINDTRYATITYVSGIVTGGMV